MKTTPLTLQAGVCHRCCGVFAACRLAPVPDFGPEGAEYCRKCRLYLTVDRFLPMSAGAGEAPAAYGEETHPLTHTPTRQHGPRSLSPESQGDLGCFGNIAALILIMGAGAAVLWLFRLAFEIGGR